MADMLLHTKLPMPLVHNALVTRPRLINLLREGLTRPFRLIGHAKLSTNSRPRHTTKLVEEVRRPSLSVTDKLW
jgi:hypothetical protein